MFHPSQRAAADGNVTIFPALAQAHAHQAAGEIHIGEFQIAQLIAADAGGVKDFEDGAVAQAERGGHIRHGEHPLDLVRAENDLGQAMLGAGHFEISGGILRQVSVPDEPAKETDDGCEPLALGAGGQRFAVALAVLVEVNLITVNRFPPDATGLMNFPAFTEMPEVAQLLELAGDGLLAVIDRRQMLQVTVGFRPEFIACDCGVWLGVGE